MSERFTKLYELQKNLYSEGSPVVVSAGALLKDTQTNNIIVQLKFHSVSAKAITALKVGIAAFDIAGKEIDGVSEYQFLDLNIHNGQEFGSKKAIVMPNLVTRSFSIKNITVVLADGCVQSVSLPFSPLPNPEAIRSVLADAELITQYKLKTNDSAVYIPQKSLDLWQCHCGEWNSCSVCSRCNGQKSTIFSAFDLPLLTNEMNARLAEEAQRKAEIEQQKAEQARIQAEKKAKRTAAVKKGAKRTLIVIGAIVAVCIALVIAGIIFLFATDKPIDNDFSKRMEYSLHSLTYFAPENWEEDFEYNQSNENTKIHVRYDNWGKFVCMMGVVYHGETQQISIEDVVSDYTSEYKDATTKSRQIGEQEFTVISYVRTDDYNGCNVYVTESESSVFEIYFRSVPESTNPVIFDEIVGAIAFDDYVNPKEGTYNEAVSLMSAEKYNEAISIFTELGGYKDSAELIAQCQSAIWDDMLENATELIAKGSYYDAINILEELGDHRDSEEQLKIAQYGYANSLFSDGKYSDAATIFKNLGNYENSIELHNQSQYAYALSLMDSESYDSAIVLFEELIDHAPAKEKANECKYLLAMHCIDTFDYDGAKGYLNQILDYKDAEKYKLLLDNIVSDIYRDVGDFIWLVSRIDTNTCSSTLVMYTGRGSMKKDDKYSIDFSSTVWYEWKVVDSKYYMTSTGEQGDFYYVVTLNNGSLTEQFHNSDGSANEKYTYHILPDEESEALKKNWVQYFEDDEYGYWTSYEWVFAEATVK